MADRLTPGSRTALMRGCRCPVIDNHHGDGIPYNGTALYWHNWECPLHGNRPGAQVTGALAFVCAECGRSIVNVVGLLPEPPRCALCLSMPGWFNDPALAARLDPEHERRVPGE